MPDPHGEGDNHLRYLHLTAPPAISSDPYGLHTSIVTVRAPFVVFHDMAYRFATVPEEGGWRVTWTTLDTGLKSTTGRCPVMRTLSAG